MANRETTVLTALADAIDDLRLATELVAKNLDCVAEKLGAKPEGRPCTWDTVTELLQSDQISRAVVRAQMNEAAERRAD